MESNKKHIRQTSSENGRSIHGIVHSTGSIAIRSSILQILFMACPITINNTHLTHESRNDSMKSRSLVSKSFFSSTESSKVLDCLWDSRSIKSHFNTSNGFTIQFHIEKDLFCNFSILGSKESLQQTTNHRKFRCRGSSPWRLDGCKGTSRRSE